MFTFLHQMMIAAVLLLISSCFVAAQDEDKCSETAITNFLTGNPDIDQECTLDLFQVLLAAENQEISESSVSALDRACVDDCMGIVFDYYVANKCSEDLTDEIQRVCSRNGDALCMELAYNYFLTFSLACSASGSNSTPYDPCVDGNCTTAVNGAIEGLGCCIPRLQEINFPDVNDFVYALLVTRENCSLSATPSTAMDPCPDPFLGAGGLRACVDKLLLLLIATLAVGYLGF